MTNEELLREIKALPSEPRRFIERYVSMAAKRKQKAHVKTPTRPFRDEPAFGIWADRDDMKDGGATWVHNLRDTHWKR
ncbi:MAG: hypothetical protein ACRD6X_16915 [Pyrinomonadaceae bacterium]